MADEVTESPLVATLVAWFDAHERPLPWRRSTPWGVLVSEFMLQQTPVDRVLPVWHAWLDRWPDPAALASAPVADAIRAWGRLGYPRRAARLHAAAVVITDTHGGEVPSDETSLRALPGVGEYTAAAVQAFAYGRRAVVLDTNVRRVVARAVDGVAEPRGHLTVAERRRADLLWPSDDARAARWSAAVMEFGALVCRARVPACGDCPIASTCSWTRAGRPAPSAPARRQPRYEGSDREARGRLLAEFRAASGAIGPTVLADAWPDAEQRARALAGLIADGLIVPRPRGRYALP